MLPGANHSRFMARSGYDWILVDTEHGNIAGKSPSYRRIEIRSRITKIELSDSQMHESVAAIAATGVSPIVRIAANEGWMVKRMYLL